MNLDRDLYPCLLRVWPQLSIGETPTRLESLLIKGNRKAVFCVFADGRSEPDVIVKYAADEADWHRLENEKASIDTVCGWDTGAARTLLAPCIVERVGGGMALIRRSSPGKPMTARIRPARSAGPTVDVRDYTLAADWLLTLQERTRDRVSEQNNEVDIIQTLHQQNPAFGALDAGHAAFSAVTEAIQSGTLIPVLEHGDYNPDNIFVHRKNLGVIDWEWGRIPGLPLVDLYNLALLFCRNSAILGVTRSRPVNSQDATWAFGPGAFADHVRSHIARAAKQLDIPDAVAEDLLTLHLSRYLDRETLEEIRGDLSIKASRD